MTIRFACPKCSKSLQAPNEKAGARVRCPGCKNVLQVPNTGPPVADAIHPPPIAVASAIQPPVAVAVQSPPVRPPVAVAIHSPPIPVAVAIQPPADNATRPTWDQTARSESAKLRNRFLSLSKGKRWAVVGGGIFIFLILVSVFSSKDGRGRTSGPAIKIDAFALFREYHSNEVAADEKYKGKMLEISGTIAHIGKDFRDSIYVSLHGGGQFEILSIQCFFSDKHKAETAKLIEGIPVMIRGKCDGKLGNVLIKNCEFVH